MLDLLPICKCLVLKSKSVHRKYFHFIMFRFLKVTNGKEDFKRALDYLCNRAFPKIAALGHLSREAIKDLNF